MTLADLLRTYLADRTDANLAPLHDVVLAAPTFDRELALHPKALELIKAGDFEGLASWLSSLMPGALLSPSAHRLLALAHAKLGRDADADRERVLARLALDAIRTSGDGSAERPWRVLRTGDEYDVLEAEHKRSDRVETREQEGTLYDIHTCDDASQVWFEFVS